MAEWLGELIASWPAWAVVATAVIAGTVTCAWFVLADWRWPGKKKERK